MNDVTDVPETRQHAPAPGSGAQTVPVPRDFSELVVSNGSGSVEVVAAERPDILVEWFRRDDHRAPGVDEAVVVVRVEDGRLHVHPERAGAKSEPRPERTDREGWEALIDGAVRLVGMAAASVIASMARFDIRVEVPTALRNGSIRVQTGAAPVRLRGLGAAIDVKTAAAEIDVAGCVGDVAATTASGEIRLHETRGQIQARSASGDVRVRGMTPRLQIETASGSIDATVLPGVEGEATLRTVSGDVRLTLPAGPLPAGGKVSVKTVSGSVEAGDGFAERGRREWTFEGGGPLRFEAQTVSGSVRLARAELGPAAPAEPVQAAAPTPARTAARTTPTPTEAAERATTIPITRAESANAEPAPEAPGPSVAANGAEAAPAEPRPFAPNATVPPSPPEAAERTGAAPESTAARRRRVLEAVERGDIDVEEALRLLDDAGNASD